MNGHTKQRWLTISNMLSVLRIVITPIIVSAMLAHSWSVAFGLFVGASITDLLDGYIARRFHEQTVLGHYLDPLADKILLLSCFCTFTYVQFATVPLPTWFIILALVREVIIVFGGALLVCAKHGRATTPTFLGKLTTASYMFLIVWMFMCYFAEWLPRKSFLGVVVAVASVAAISLGQYCWRGWRILAQKNI